jgi:hypothetical protein
VDARTSLGVALGADRRLVRLSGARRAMARPLGGDCRALGLLRGHGGVTVIVWDGTTLAADRRACANGFTYSVTKIARVGDCLVALSGYFGRFGLYKAWLASGRNPELLPPRPHDDREWSQCLVIHRDGAIERFEGGSPAPIIVEERWHTMGSGRDYAAAALYLGCDAARAVEVASALSEECGNGVDTLTFDAP